MALDFGIVLEDFPPPSLSPDIQRNTVSCVFYLQMPGVQQLTFETMLPRKGSRPVLLTANVLRPSCWPCRQSYHQHVSVPSSGNIFRRVYRIQTWIPNLG